MRGVVLDAVPLELAAPPARLLEERRVAADGEELLHLVVEELVVLARRPALEEERLAAELLDLVGVVGRGLRGSGIEMTPRRWRISAQSRSQVKNQRKSLGRRDAQRGQGTSTDAHLRWHWGRWIFRLWGK